MLSNPRLAHSVGSATLPWALLLVVCWMGAAVAHGSEVAQAAATKPNIVVFMADDWSWPHAGALGDPVVKTPNFDRVAREGVLFENAFVSTPSCTPSRLSILAGQHHWRLKEGDSLGGSLREEFEVYTDRLQTAGYRIGRFGKGVWPSQHTFRRRDSFGERFRSFDEFIKNRKPGEPFCYWHGGQDPHRPYEMNVGVNSGIALADVKVPACLPDTQTVRSDVADYLWEVQRFDREVGQVVARLTAIGELDNTIIIVSGDNGMPFPRCKATLYDQGTRVPLAIRWPAKVQGRRKVADFVNLCDLAPTFLAAAGLAPSTQMTGRSLMPILDSKQSGQIDPARTYVITGMERHVYSYPSRALRNIDFLYIRNFDPDKWPTGEFEGHNPEFDFMEEPWPKGKGVFSFNIDPSPTKQYLRLNRNDERAARFANLAFAPRPVEELYDLRKDPDQIHNVAGDASYMRIKQRLRRQLDAELIKTQDPRLAVTEIHNRGIGSRAEDEFPTPANRPRVVIVKPVILCDDDGSNPAPHALPKALVDRVYTKAGLEFIYLEPTRWHFGKARRGEINLDEIVREGRKSRIISHDRRVVTLLCVSAVDGRRGPLGRGQQNGNVCFVAFGPTDTKIEPAMQAFVVAHEVGHCLGLQHVVDDPAVPDDIPNLQGDGPFDQRLGVAGLHDTQRDTVLRSPLVLDRIAFHGLEEGRRLIADESWEPYISAAPDDMLRFSIGLKADAPIPQEAALRNSFASQKYAEKVLAFTDQERKVLKRLVERLAALRQVAWPAVTRLPWHFIKVDSSFCKGMAHTRGMAIVLSDQHVRRMADNERYGMKLLLHEKLHVIQRLNGPRFESLYEDYGFQKMKLADGELQRFNVAQNPDALQLNWAVRLGETSSMLITVLVPGDKGGFRFRTEHRELHAKDDGSYSIGAETNENEAFQEWRANMPLRDGLEHPNEVSAYLSGLLLDDDFLEIDKKPRGATHVRRIDQTRLGFQQSLKIGGE